jgi:hypothetical protein
MMTRLLSFCFFLSMVLSCTVTIGQLPGTQDVSVQNNKLSPSGLPPITTNVPVISSPTQAQVKDSQGPTLTAAPNTTVNLTPEQGFAGLPPAAGSVSDHDIEKGQDILEELVGTSTDQVFSQDSRASFDSAFTDALSAMSERIGSTTSSTYLQRTLPGIIGSQAVADVLGGGAQLLDSEPVDGPALDSPEPVRWGQSLLSNLGSVAGGNPSPFADPNLIQACNRLRAYFTQTQFLLNATQQNQVQYVLSTDCSQQTGTGGVQTPYSNVGTSTRIAPAPPAPSAQANPSSCAPPAKVCR